MFGFIIKKNFCDGWDNLLSVIVSNLVFLFSGLGMVILNGLASKTESQIRSEEDMTDLHRNRSAD